MSPAPRRPRPGSPAVEAPVADPVSGNPAPPEVAPPPPRARSAGPRRHRVAVRTPGASHGPGPAARRRPGQRAPAVLWSGPGVALAAGVLVAAGILGLDPLAAVVAALQLAGAVAWVGALAPPSPALTAVLLGADAVAADVVLSLVRGSSAGPIVGVLAVGVVVLLVLPVRRHPHERVAQALMVSLSGLAVLVGLALFIPLWRMAGGQPDLEVLGAALGAQALVARGVDRVTRVAPLRGAVRRGWPGLVAGVALGVGVGAGLAAAVGTAGVGGAEGAAAGLTAAGGAILGVLVCVAAAAGDLLAARAAGESSARPPLREVRQGAAGRLALVLPLALGGPVGFVVVRAFLR